MLDPSRKPTCLEVPSVQQQPESIAMHAGEGRWWEPCDVGSYDFGPSKQLVRRQESIGDFAGLLSQRSESLKQPALRCIPRNHDEQIRQYSFLERLLGDTASEIDSLQQKLPSLRIYAYREKSYCNNCLSKGDPRTIMREPSGTSFRSSKTPLQELTSGEVDLVEISKASEAELPLDLAVAFPSLRQVLLHEASLPGAFRDGGGVDEMPGFGILIQVDSSFASFAPEALLDTTELVVCLARVVVELRKAIQVQREGSDEAHGCMQTLIKSPREASALRGLSTCREIQSSSLRTLVQVVDREYGYSQRRGEKVNEAFAKAAALGRCIDTRRKLPLLPEFMRRSCESLALALLDDLSAPQLTQVYCACCALNNNCLLNDATKLSVGEGLGLGSSTAVPPRQEVTLIESTSELANATEIALLSLAISTSQLLSRDPPDGELVVLTKMALLFEDAGLLEACYWRVRSLVGKNQVPDSWLRAPEIGKEVKKPESERALTKMQGSDAEAEVKVRDEFRSLYCGALSVPLQCFEGAVAAESRRKQVYLSSPKGYLHGSLYRVRASPKAYPHLYLLCGPRDHPLCQQVQSCVDSAQVGLSSCVVCPSDRRLFNECEDRVLLLGMKRGEHSEVDFYSPEGVVADHAKVVVRHACQLDFQRREGAERTESSEAEETKKAEAKRAEADLLAVCRARLSPHCRSFLGSLRPNFWGTRFTLRSWGGGFADSYQGSATAREASLSKDASSSSSSSSCSSSPLPLCRFATASVSRDETKHSSAFPTLKYRRWTPRKSKTEEEKRKASLTETSQAQKEASLTDTPENSSSFPSSSSSFSSSFFSSSSVNLASSVANGKPPRSSRETLARGLPHSEARILSRFSFSRNLSGEVPRRMKATLLRDEGQYSLEPVSPKWNEAIKAFTMPFYGRAIRSSAKNFQLTPAGSNDCSISFMFGKMDKDVFSVDFREPVRIIEAAAMAAAALAKKRAVA